MKYILVLLISITLISCASTLPAAGPSTTQMEKADKIIITVDQSADEAYKSFASHLSSNNFSFENSDEVIRVLKTDYKNYEGSSQLQYQLNASISDDSTTTISVNGQAVMNVLGTFEIKNKGMAGSPVDEVWTKMHDVVTSYPHKQVYYSRN